MLMRLETRSSTQSVRLPSLWYAPLNANLNEAKSHALIWVRDIAPKIGSEIPQTIINYNNRFLVTAEMLSIVGDKQS